MIKVIIFDLDGVIIESAEIKTRAFELLFADYPDKLPEMIDYHIRNSGFSRFVKFRHFYKNILGQKLSADKEKALGERFSQIVLDEVLKAPLVAGAEDFLKSHYRRYLQFAASGTPEEELRYILKQRGLDIYFKGIYGTPKTKPEIIKQILTEHQLSNREAVFIGDAESDKMAAKEAGIIFIAKTSSNDKTLNNYTWKIHDFTSLEELLDRISKTL